MALTKNAAGARGEILSKVAAEANTPEFSQIQDTVAAVLLPALAKAITQLQVVYNDTSFSLTLMVDGSPRKLGHPEAAVLLAGFKATHALATLLLSYDFTIDQNGSYAYLDTLSNIQSDETFSTLSVGQKAALNALTDLFTSSSPFLAVRSGWATKLSGVDGEIQSAVATLQAGLATVGTVASSNEILHLCSKFNNSSCTDDGDFNNALNDLDTVSKYLNQPYAVTVGSGATDTVAKVNFAAFFSVQDYKKLLPYYGFYNSSTWSETNPVIYFTNAGGTTTGNYNTVSNIFNNGDLTPAQKVAQLKAVVFWKDPTFQGFLPGATSDQVWDLIRIQMVSSQSSDNNSSGTSSGDTTYYNNAVNASSLLSPNFALSLIGR